MLKSISIKIEEDLLNELNEVALKTERSKSFYIKEAIKHYLPHLHELPTYKEELSDQTVKNIKEYELDKKKGTLETISAEQLWNELDV